MLMFVFVLLCRNDEIQSIRALKANDASEKIMKAKLEYKVRWRCFVVQCLVVNFGAFIVIDHYPLLLFVKMTHIAPSPSSVACPGHV